MTLARVLHAFRSGWRRCEGHTRRSRGVHLAGTHPRLWSRPGDRCRYGRIEAKETYADEKKGQKLHKLYKKMPVLLL